MILAADWHDAWEELPACRRIGLVAEQHGLRPEALETHALDG